METQILQHHRPEKESRLPKHLVFYSLETLIGSIIFIHGNTGKIHIRGIFFVAFRNAYYNRSFSV